MEQTATAPRRKWRITPIGIGGLVIAIIALVGAALSPWAVAALRPEPKPIDEVAVDIVGRIQDRLAARAQGEEYVAPAKPAASRWPQVYMASVIGTGSLAICMGVFGLVLRHDRRLNAATVAVGASAIVFQYALLLAAALLLILLIGLILAALESG